jgi:hypothetical protein
MAQSTGLLRDVMRVLTTVNIRLLQPPTRPTTNNDQVLDRSA